MALEMVIIHVLAGAALGLRFKVMILVPAVTLTMLFAAMVGVTRGAKFSSIATSCSNNCARKIHLAQQPPAEDDTVRIGTYLASFAASHRADPDFRPVEGAFTSGLRHLLRF